MQRPDRPAGEGFQPQNIHENHFFFLDQRRGLRRAFKKILRRSWQDVVAYSFRQEDTREKCVMVGNGQEEGRGAKSGFQSEGGGGAWQLRMGARSRGGSRENQESGRFICSFIQTGDQCSNHLFFLPLVKAGFPATNGMRWPNTTSANPGQRKWAGVSEPPVLTALVRTPSSTQGHGNEPELRVAVFMVTRG